MIKLKNILLEILNSYSVEVDLIIDPQFNTYDILNEIRALKFVTRGKANIDLQGFLDDTLTKDGGDNDLRIQGVKHMGFRNDTLNRL